MRRLIGVGTPRGLQGRIVALIMGLVGGWRTIMVVGERSWTPWPDFNPPPSVGGVSVPLSSRWLKTGTCTTGC
jgi:hypothetical protein